MSRPSTLRWLATAPLWISGALLLSASSCVTPEVQPVPGQKLTWAQQHHLDMLKYQQINNDRINN